MAREHANIRLDMWSDDSWRALTVPAQHLYMHLLSSPSLSYVGVADWRPARIAGVSKGSTVGTVSKAVDELVQSVFVVCDDETEEILIRSFLKHDGLLKKPNVSKAMASAFAKTISPTLRGVVVHELQKLHGRNPEWHGFSVVEVQELLSRPSINPRELLAKGSPKGSVKGSESDASLLTTNYLLPATSNSLLTTSPNVVRDDVLELCNLLADLIESNGSLRPTIGTGWHDAARLLLDKDKRGLESAARLIRWVQADSFWQGNVLSMPTFRQKYDQLRLAANSQQAQNKARPSKEDRAIGVLEQGRRMQAEADRKAIGQ